MAAIGTTRGRGLAAARAARPADHAYPIERDPEVKTFMRIQQMGSVYTAGGKLDFLELATL